jgi:hypothetical protein
VQAGEIQPLLKMPMLLIDDDDDDDDDNNNNNNSRVFQEAIECPITLPRFC